MDFSYNSTATSTDVSINTLFSLFKKEITALHYRINKEEDIREKSNLVDKLLSYYLSFYYGIIYANYISTYTTQPISYFIDKFNVPKVRDCFSCKGIDVDKVFEALHISREFYIGINGLEVEETLEIEPDELPNEIKVNVKELLRIPSLCTTNLTLQ